jgi:hypothetical protein
MICYVVINIAVGYKTCSSVFACNLSFSANCTSSVLFSIFACEYQTEAKSSPVDQTEANNIRSDEKIAKNEQRILSEREISKSDQNNSIWTCKYCSFQTDTKKRYEYHSVNKHQNWRGYPDKYGRTR